MSPYKPLIPGYTDERYKSSQASPCERPFFFIILKQINFYGSNCKHTIQQRTDRRDRTNFFSKEKKKEDQACARKQNLCAFVVLSGATKIGETIIARAAMESI